MISGDEKAEKQLGAIVFGLALCAIASREKVNVNSKKLHGEIEAEAQAIADAFTERLKSV